MKSDEVKKLMERLEASRQMDDLEAHRECKRVAEEALALLESENAPLREQLKAGLKWKYPTAKDVPNFIGRNHLANDLVDTVMDFAREVVE